MKVTIPVKKLFFSLLIGGAIPLLVVGCGNSQDKATYGPGGPGAPPAAGVAQTGPAPKVSTGRPDNLSNGKSGNAQSPVVSTGRPDNLSSR